MLAAARFLVLIMSCIALSACGFKLRTTPPLPAVLQTLYIESDAPFNPLTLQLEQILKSADITLTDSAKTAPYTLKIYGENFYSDVLSESASSNTKQYTLHFTVNYQLLRQDGSVVYANSIAIARNYTVNENQVLSTDSQQATLQTEMQREAVFRLLTQLSSEKVVSALSQPIKKT